MCTLGYACRAIIRHACGGDPDRLASLANRFVGVVFPGDTLTTEGWRVEDGKYYFRTLNQEGRPVLGNGVFNVVANRN